MNYELTLGVPAIAVGLSAISLLATSSPRSQNSVTFPIPVLRPKEKLAKDAAPIPNALAAAVIKFVRTHYASQKTDSSVGAKDYKQTVKHAA